MNENRLYETFKEMVQIDSESRKEKDFHKYLIKLFNSLELNIIEDNSADKSGLETNNLVAILKGEKNVDPIFFSCHTDTVAPGKGIIPVLKEDGNIYSSGNTILAADDKAGIAILVETIRQLKEENIKHGDIEFVFFPGEEIGLLGSANFDENLLKSNYGFVLDSGGDVGSMVVGSPNLYSVSYKISGKSAHAGLEPEKGVSAIEIAAKAIADMELGRIDSETTANIGEIKGGVATNVVAEEVLINAEVRSISDEKAQKQLVDMLNSLESVATKLGGKVASKKNLLSKGYHLSKEDKTVQLAFKALKKIGRTPKTEIIGGGSDANSLYAKGKETLNLSIGYEKVHTTDEFIPLLEMEKAVELVMTIIQIHSQK